MLGLRVIMPASGDAELLQQGGGIIDLEPIFFGNEAMGPHLQLVEFEKVPAKAGAPQAPQYTAARVMARARIKVRPDGKMTLVMQSSPSDDAKE